jgi:hypothetical protein
MGVGRKSGAFSLMAMPELLTRRAEQRPLMVVTVKVLSDDFRR